METRRYQRIVLFFAVLFVNFAWWDLILPHIGLRGWSKRTRSNRLRQAAIKFRRLAVQMGGVMIKVGQFLSARVDILPEDITIELSGLQDDVPPESFPAIARVAEQEFGVSISEKFLHFEETPLAAASLGQVHQAHVLRSSTDDTESKGNPQIMEVVVKIQRPAIETLIATDLAALNTVGGWLRYFKPIRRRVNIHALLSEFGRILNEEIDYLAEGRNAEVFAKNFQDDANICVPQVVWSHTTGRVLTLENVIAIKITDYDAISRAQIDRRAVAARLFNTYLQQIFQDGFFHADPHPGNLFVKPQVESVSGSGAKSWQLTFVDFGMVGHVPPVLMEGLREMLIAIGIRDAKRLVKSYQMLNVLLPEADLDLIERAEEKSFERFWGKSMEEIRKMSHQEALEFASEFRELIYSLPFQVPHDLLFLGRAVGILSGICTGLDPQFNVWEHLAPYAQKLLLKDGQFSSGKIINEINNLGRILLGMPTRLVNLLDKIEHNRLEVQVPDVDRQLKQINLVFRQVVIAVLFAAFFLGGIQLFLAGFSRVGMGLWLVSSICLIWAIVIGRKKY